MLTPEKTTAAARRHGGLVRGSPRRCVAAVFLFCFWGLAGQVWGQVQIRLGDSTHATYSEIHEGLQPGTAQADSVQRLLTARSSRTLWPFVKRAAYGTGDWNLGLVAFNRIAELREPGSMDSVLAWRKRILAGDIPPPPATDLRDLFPGLRAIQLELERKSKGDQAVLNDFLARIADEHYDLGDAWIAGRLGAGAADSLAARFLATTDPGLRVRYLTLLSFSRDTALIPLLARIYVAPDSFALPPRAATRASDGLLWIGTRGSMSALLEAREKARARGIYADPKLYHADLDFLGNDSSMAVSRTGRAIPEWVRILR
jgi:hypothetical protein